MSNVRSHDDHAQEAHRRMKKERITEDDPRWNPKTMGNKKGKIVPKPSIGRYTDPKYKNA